MDVDLKGAASATAIENRLKIARHQSKARAKDAKRRYARRFYGFKAEEFDKLIEHDFADRAIYEANRDRRGIIAQTLVYGRLEAEKRIKAQKRAAIRARGYHIISEKEIAEKIARGLALREKRRWRL
jgi:hypothetical protein